MTRVAGVQRVGDARSVHSLTAPRARAPPPRATRRAVKAHAGHTAEPAWTRRTLLTGTGVLGASLYLPPPPALAFDNPVDRGNGYVRYFGEATSASSYGGYGGNQQDQDIENFKYWFDVPGTWKGEIVTKQQKGYQGIDAVFSNPANKTTNAYVITFPGYNKLKSDYEEIISDLALADSKLQDAVSGAQGDETFTVTERTAADGQVFVDYNIIAAPYTTLCSITTYNKRLYAILVWSTRADYEANKESLNTIRNSLEMVKQSAEDIKAAQYFQRGAINCTMGEC